MSLCFWARSSNLTAGAPGNTGTAPTAANGTNQNWVNYWEWVNKDFTVQLKALREENKELGTGSA